MRGGADPAGAGRGRDGPVPFAARRPPTRRLPAGGVGGLIGPALPVGPVAAGSTRAAAGAAPPVCGGPTARPVRTATDGSRRLPGPPGRRTIACVSPAVRGAGRAGHAPSFPT